MTLSNVLTQQMKEFDKLFPCIESNCDNNGTISGYDQDGDLEAQQCQWCFEKRLPIKSFLRSSFLALLESIGEEVIGKDEPRRKDYSIMNPYRRMDEENREKLNAYKQKLRTRLTEIIKTVKE